MMFIVTLLGNKRSGKTSLANALSTHRVDSDSEVHIYEGKAGVRIHDPQENCKFVQKLARSSLNMVTCSRDTTNFNTTKEHLALARTSNSKVPTALIVTKNDLKPMHLGVSQLGKKYGVDFTNTTWADHNFEKKILQIMTERFGADRLFYTSSTQGAGIRDLENWILDIKSTDTEYADFGGNNSREHLLLRVKHTKKKYRETGGCAEMSCDSCQIQ